MRLNHNIRVNIRQGDGVFNVHNILKDAISELVQHKPQRPYAFLRDYFGTLEALSNTRSNSIDSNGSAASKYLYY